MLDLRDLIEFRDSGPNVVLKALYLRGPAAAEAALTGWTDTVEQLLRAHHLEKLATKFDREWSEPEQDGAETEEWFEQRIGARVASLTALLEGPLVDLQP